MPIVLGLFVIVGFVVFLGRPTAEAEDLYYDAEYEVAEGEEDATSESEEVDSPSVAVDKEPPAEESNPEERVNAAALAKQIFDDVQV